MDKIDPENLARDARMLLASVYTIAGVSVLPFDQTDAVDQIRQALATIAEAAGDGFDLTVVQQDADALRVATERLRERTRQPASDAVVAALSACQMQVSHLLIPVNYTVSGPFGQDPALGALPVPELRPTARLTQLPADSPERFLLLTQLRRERNRLRHALVMANRAIEQVLAVAE